MHARFFRRFKRAEKSQHTNDLWIQQPFCMEDYVSTCCILLEPKNSHPMRTSQSPHKSNRVSVSRWDTRDESPERSKQTTVCWFDQSCCQQRGGIASCSQKTFCCASQISDLTEGTQKGTRSAMIIMKFIITKFLFVTYIRSAWCEIPSAVDKCK